MNARLLTTAALVSVLSGLLPAKAADPQLLNLVMPDATVLAGVNVDQAKTSPMGQYVLNQVQASGNATELQKFTALTGLDPTRDIHEILVATTATGNTRSHTGILLARGNFDPARIQSFLSSHNAATQVYNGVTIIGDPKEQGGIAFLDATIAAAGDMANLKAAIDRQRTPTSLPSAVTVRVNQWSGTQDAWAITTVPPSSFNFIGMPPLGNQQQQNPVQNAFTGIQHVAGGVKFGANVVVTAQVQASTSQDATQLGDTLKLLASLAQLQSNADPNVTALAQSLNVNTNASVLNVSLSMPQDQLVNLVKQGPRQTAPKQLHKK